MFLFLQQIKTGLLERSSVYILIGLIKFIVINTDNVVV